MSPSLDTHLQGWGPSGQFQYNHIHVHVHMVAFHHTGLQRALEQSEHKNTTLQNSTKVLEENVKKLTSDLKTARQQNAVLSQEVSICQSCTCTYPDWAQNYQFMDSIIESAMGTCTCILNVLLRQW